MENEYYNDSVLWHNITIFEWSLSLMMFVGVMMPYMLVTDSGWLKICIYCTYFTAALIFASAALTFINSRLLMSTVLLIALMFWAVIVSGHMYSLADLGNMLNMVCLQFTIMGCSLMPSRQALIKRFVICNFVLSGVYLSLMRTNYDEWEGFRTFGFGNPNQAAIFLMLSAIVLIISYNYWDKRISKAINSMLLVGLIYMIYCCGSRTCFFSVLLCIVMTFINRRKLPKWIIPFIVSVPLVFLFVYTALFNSGKFMDLQLLGRTFYSGREHYFQSVLSEWKSFILFGDFFTYQMGNLHNGYLAILASFGVIAFIFYYFHSIRNLEEIRQNVDNHTSFIALIAILTTFFQMSSESMVTTGNYSVTVYIGMLYYIATYLEGYKNDYK